jgi:hypothetical protein
MSCAILHHVRSGVESGEVDHFAGSLGVSEVQQYDEGAKNRGGDALADQLAPARSLVLSVSLHPSLIWEENRSDKYPSGSFANRQQEWLPPVGRHEH